MDADTSFVAAPEIRDYARINAQVAQCLAEGKRRIIIRDAEGQRLLLCGLNGPWRAVIEIEGRCGPELAYGMDSPGLDVVCRGPAEAGAGSLLRSGRIVILGDAGDLTGYRQAGGTILVTGHCGHRAGLEMSAGTLIIGSGAGRLLGEAQAGGSICLVGGPIGIDANHRRRAGTFVRLDSLDRTSTQERAPRAWLREALSSIATPLPEALCDRLLAPED